MEHDNIFPDVESRSGSHRLVGIASLCLTLNLAGFLVVSYVPSVLHINHRAATVPFRCLVLALSLYAIYKILALSHLRLAVSVTTLLAVMFFLGGWICILLGILAEVIMRTYYESQAKTTYQLGEIRQETTVEGGEASSEMNPTDVREPDR